MVRNYMMVKFTLLCNDLKNKKNTIFNDSLLFLDFQSIVFEFSNSIIYRSCY